MKTVEPGDKRRLQIAVGLLVALAAIVVYLLVSGRLGPLCADLWKIFENKDSFREYVESWGKMAPAAFIILQALQVVFAPIPGELTGAVGGFVFGAWANIIYSTIGLTFGSMAAFLSARIIGMPLVKLIVSRQSLDRFHFLTERRGAIISFFMFAIPGFPKDILSYILGLSPMGWLMFFWISTIGRIPGTIMLSYSGSAIYEEDWTLLIALAIGCGLVFVVVFFQRERIEKWLRQRHKHSS
jgi:uncharacterized membrane protein YdjX (TVP38/TMEM64 family)